MFAPIILGSLLISIPISNAAKRHLRSAVGEYDQGLSEERSHYHKDIKISIGPSSSFLGLGLNVHY